MIEDIHGNTLSWNWGLAGRGLDLHIKNAGVMPCSVYLSDYQVEELVKILCFKIAGEYVPHCANGKAKAAISHSTAEWAMLALTPDDNLSPQRKREFANARAEIRAALIAAGGRV